MSRYIPAPWPRNLSDQKSLTADEAQGTTNWLSYTPPFHCSTANAASAFLRTMSAHSDVLGARGRRIAVSKLHYEDLKNFKIR